MTYKEFIREAQKKQRAYISSERRRYTKAQRLWDRYASAMADLNLHPLDRHEITDRLKQLDLMELDIPHTHGDTVAMRFAYETRHKEQPACS